MTGTAVTAGRAREWIRKITGFRLGQFSMYPPRPLRLPPHYEAQPRGDKCPSISIVTPVFNQASYIEQTVASVLGQNYPALQYIVMDGGSTDGTAEKLYAIRDRLSHLHSGPDDGQTAAINAGMRYATGDILAWLNGDDIVLPGTLDYVSTYFENHPDVDVVYGHRIIIDENGQDIGRWVLPTHSDSVLDWADFVPQETLYWRRSIWRKIGEHLDDSFQFAMDWDFLLRLRDAGARFARVPRYLGGFRSHSRQKTLAEMPTTGLQEIARIHQRTLGHIPGRMERAWRLAPYIARHAVLQRADRLFGLY